MHLPEHRPTPSLLSRTKSSALLRGAKTFHLSPLRPLNDGVRHAYARGIVPLLELDLSFREELAGSEVRARGSVVSRDGFNACMSDLDLSVFVPGLPSDERFEVLNARVRVWKRLFPVLGEVEVYTFAERVAYDNYLRRIGPLYDFFRSLRKLVWMERALDSAHTPYHAYKALLSRNRCARKLGISPFSVESEKIPRLDRVIDRFIRERFPLTAMPGLTRLAGLRVHVSYLGLPVVFVPSGEALPRTEPIRRLGREGLRLPAETALPLLALSPAFRADQVAELQGAIHFLRASSEIRETRRLLAEFECLIAGAVARTRPDANPQAWRDALACLD